MNKPAIFILTLACALALVGCSPNKETKNLSDDMPFAETPDANLTTPGDMPADEVFDIVISHASRADFGAIYSGALNEETMMFSSVLHLPIYKFDSLEELEQFKAAFGDSLGMDGKYDGALSFNEATSGRDEAFFEENSLMLVYVDVSNKASDLEVSSIFCDGNTFCIHIMPRNGSKSTTNGADSYRLITVAVPKSMIKDCTEFDADFNNDTN